MNTMTVQQLRAVCDQKKIKYTSKTTKPELIALLKKSKKVAKVEETPFNGEY